MAYQYRGAVFDAHIPIPPDEPKSAPRARQPRERITKTSTPKKRREFTPDKCGTDQGYERHKYRKVPACPECKAAHAARRKAERHLAGVAA